jgi:hypothetical protein
MTTIRRVLSSRLSNDALDSRLGQLACDLGAIAIVPTAVVALIRHPGSRADLLFGLGLACLLGLLLAMLGTLCRRGAGLHGKLSLWSRWPEFVSCVVCIGLLVLGISSLADLGLTPVQVTLGLLLICSLSLAVLVLGMTTTLVRALKA